MASTISGDLSRQIDLYNVAAQSSRRAAAGYTDTNDAASAKRWSNIAAQWECLAKLTAQSFHSIVARRTAACYAGINDAVSAKQWSDRAEQLDRAAQWERWERLANNGTQKGAAPINATSQVAATTYTIAATTYTMPDEIGKYLCASSSLDSTFLSRKHTLQDLTQTVSDFRPPKFYEAIAFGIDASESPPGLGLALGAVGILVLAGLLISLLVVWPLAEQVAIGGCVVCTALSTVGLVAVGVIVYYNAFRKAWHAFEEKIKEAQQYYKTFTEEGAVDRYISLQDFLNRVPLTRAPLLDAPHSLYPPSDPSSYTYT